jgi:hypothetical protein
MGRTNRYVVAYTPHTLILADMEADKVRNYNLNVELSLFSVRK